MKPNVPQGPGLALTLLVAMLLIVGLSVGSTFIFSDLAVKREFRRLPPEVRRMIQAQQQAQPRDAEGRADPLRPGGFIGPLWPLGSSSVWPSVSGTTPVLRTADGQAVLGPLPANRNRPFAGRTRNFLRDVQGSLIKVGLIAALASALLAWALSRRLARPILAVSAAAQQLAQGKLEVRAPLYPAEREVAQLAQSFNRMAASLQQLEQERQQAVADVAHELRTPIAVMQARLDALEDGVYPLDLAQIVLLSGQTQLLTRLVDDLRTLTLLDAGRLHLHLRVLDLSELVQQLSLEYEDRAAPKQCRFVSHTTEALVRADPLRLRQIVVNLLENAFHHARSTIWLELELQSQVVVLHVDDDGPGIPPESRQQVFTRFARLDASRSRDTGGSGLGLSIVQALVSAHGGRIEVSSSPLGGARFSLTLGRHPGPGAVQ